MALTNGCFREGRRDRGEREGDRRQRDGGREERDLEVKGRRGERIELERREIIGG